jgi:hypothetical protein
VGLGDGHGLDGGWCCAGPSEDGSSSAESQPAAGRMLAVAQPPRSPSCMLTAPSAGATIPRHSPSHGPSIAKQKLADKAHTLAGWCWVCVQRVGANAEEYWRTLKCFLEMGLTKAELDEQVPLLIGLHNVRHHNEFIRAIVTNACSVELPPQTSVVPSLPPVFPSSTGAHAAGMMGEGRAVWPSQHGCRLGWCRRRIRLHRNPESSGVVLPPSLPHPLAAVRTVPRMQGGAPCLYVHTEELAV